MAQDQSLIGFLDRKIDDIRDSLRSDIAGLSGKVEAYLKTREQMELHFEERFVAKRTFKLAVATGLLGFVFIMGLMATIHGAESVAVAVPKAVSIAK